MLPAAHWLAVTATRHAGAMAPRPGHEARGRRSLISRPHPWPSTSRHAELASAKTRDNDHKNKSSWDTEINPTQKWQELSLQTYFEMMDRYLLSNNFFPWLFCLFHPVPSFKMKKGACVNLIKIPSKSHGTRKYIVENSTRNILETSAGCLDIYVWIYVINEI